MNDPNLIETIEGVRVSIQCMSLALVIVLAAIAVAIMRK